MMGRNLLLILMSMSRLLLGNTGWNIMTNSQALARVCLGGDNWVDRLTGVCR